MPLKGQLVLKAYTLVVLLAFMMVATAVLGGNGGVFSDRDVLPPSLAVDRIAFVDPERRIRTVSPDGVDEMTVSPDGDGQFAWPTWSPDGRRLVFSGISGGETEARSVLYARNTITNGLREIHSSEPGVRRLVARDAPHYSYWSPDGNMLAFIGSSPRGLKLYVDDIRDDVGPTLMLSDGPMWLGWSPDSRQAVGNLLDNALKFTPAGGAVEVSLRSEDGWAALAIEDTGIGIPETDLAYLFERFHRGGNSSRFPGSGLGLTIAQAIAAAHGGNISAESRPQGSRFALRVPLAS